MPQIVDVELDAYAYAQLRVLRREWHKLKPAHQVEIQRTAQSSVLANVPGNIARQFQLPENCSPAEIYRLREIVGYWPRIPNDIRVDLIDAALQFARLDHAA